MMPTRDDYDSENNNYGISHSDGFNNNLPSGMQNTTGLSKAELRKSNKPIMEKRRRARINQSLNKMKALILEAMKKDPARHTKLEKADILEMTVKYLQSVQRQQLSMAIQTDPTVIHKFKAGFAECADEVIRYVGTLDGVDSGVKSRLANHLTTCTTGLDQIGTFSSFTAGYRSNCSAFSPRLPANPPINGGFPMPQDVNNNGRIQMGGVQLIPSRLPSGEIALIMPNSTNIPFFPSTMATAQGMDLATSFTRTSAFSKPNLGGPMRSSTHTMTASSPPLSPISSISSCGDDSMHTSSDFLMKTPPLSQSLSSSFETPPSSELYKFVSITGHLQQQHVSSTSEIRSDAVEVTKKRIRTDDDIVDVPEKRVKIEKPEKRIKLEYPVENQNSTKDIQTAMDSSCDMWRPW